MKKIFSILLAATFALCLFTSCGIKPDAEVSSAITQAEQNALNSETQSTGSENSSSKKSSSTVSTISHNFDRTPTPTSNIYSNRTPLRSNSAENPNNKTESSSVKVYKNSGTVMIGAYAFRLTNCTANGNDDESRLAEYTDVINQGYFNTYFISSDTNVLTQAELIAEAGGTFWLHVGEYRKSKVSIESFMEDAEYYVDLLTRKGYGNILNGFYWDEPVWRGMTNEEFLTMTESLYKKFGLRNFPVFATGEFSGLEGNEIGVEADDMNKVMSSSLKYVTDVAFDAYGVDVRDGAVPTTETLERWQTNISPNVTDTKSYYTEYKKKLQEHVGHPVNIWYYPCCYEAPVGTGLNNIKRADEDYCLAHLEFMAQDILKEEYPGGVVLYTYYTSGDRYGLQRHLAIKDSKGNYKYYPNEVKWDKYCAALKKICAKFNSVKAKRADIGV